MKADNCLLTVSRALCGADVSGSLIVAVSGGPDSVALLHMLCTLGGYTLIAAHLNHGIRGASADGDASFVRSLCKNLGVECAIENANVPMIASSRGISLEEAARDARYEFLRRVKDEHGARFIVTAHHMNDQAETVLMHILRGSGLNGLCGMRPVSGDVIRPMLKLSRADIMDYVERLGLTYRVDETNLTPCCTRNRIRLELMPELSKYNPNIAESLASLAELANYDELYLDGLAIEAVKSSRLDDNIYERNALSNLPVPLQSRAAKSILADAGIPYDRKLLERVTSLFFASTGTSVSLPGGITARVRYRDLVIGRETERDLEYEAKLSIPGETVTPYGYFRTSWVNALRKDEGKLVAYMDADKLPANAIARRRRDGDVFHPLGAGGARNLRRYLIDKKFPREERNSPLIACGAEVLFFPGGTLSHTVRVTDETKRILRVEYIIQNIDG